MQNFVLRSFDLFPAKKIWDWYRVAWGVTVREEWLLNSAKIWIDSPTKWLDQCKEAKSTYAAASSTCAKCTINNIYASFEKMELHNSWYIKYN